MEVVECYALCKVRVRSGYRAQDEQCRPYGTVRRYEHGRVLDLLRECQELLAQCVCRLVLGVRVIMVP